MTMTALLAGCGGSTANVQNPPPPPPPSNLTIAFQPQPAASISVGFAESVTAVVTNDPNNYGVDWGLTCPADPDNKSLLCGSLSALHTASGTPTTYTAPTSIAANNMTVEIVAYATADRNTNAVAPVTIGTFNNQFSGTFVLQAQGADSSLNPYQFAGVIVLDGKGGISSGEQTFNFFDPATQGFVSRSDAITPLGSSYFLGSDGRGAITLQTNDADIGTENFSLVFISNSQALIAALPTGTANNPVLSISGAGTMDIQASSPAAPVGGYAFVASGMNAGKATLSPLAIGGVFNIDSPKTISGTGSVADEILGKKVNPGTSGTPSTLSGTVTAPDQLGAVQVNLTTIFGTNGKSTPVQFTGYIVDETHIKLIESDDASGTGFGLTAGLAIGQGSATGSFTSDASFSGTYVFDMLGTDLSINPNTSVTNTAPATLTSVGMMTADGGGNLSKGFTDTFLELNTAQGTVNQPQSGAQISAAFAGTYSVDSSGTGRVLLALDDFNPTPTHGYQPELFLYLTGHGNPALLLQAADSDTGETHYPSLGTGVAYPQSGAPPALSGDYALSFTQQSSSGSIENDGTAQMNVNATATPPLSGVADVDLDFGTVPGQPFVGSFSTPAAEGFVPGTLEAASPTTSAVFNPQIAVDYYAIDASHGFFVETDLVTVGAAQNGQVSLGYYSARSPVCASSCP
jgi:hypothetical protein